MSGCCAWKDFAASWKYWSGCAPLGTYQKSIVVAVELEAGDPLQAVPKISPARISPARISAAVPEASHLMSLNL